MDRFERAAYLSVKKALRRADKNSDYNKTDIAKSEAVLAEEDSIIKTAKSNNRIDMGEEEAFSSEFRKKVVDMMEPGITLEPGLERFYIPEMDSEKKEKVCLKPRDKFEIASETDFDEVYNSAGDVFVSKSEFKERALQLIDQLYKKHPQLFDPETGLPLTPVHPVIIKKNTQKTRGTIQSEYRAELEKLSEHLKKIYAEQKNGNFLHILPQIFLKIKASDALDAMVRNRICLYMPKLYHGYSLKMAGQHTANVMGDDFELCDPLTGLSALIQNFNSYFINQPIIYKLAFHKYQTADSCFCVQIADCDSGLSTAETEIARKNITSGLIFDPE